MTCELFAFWICIIGSSLTWSSLQYKSEWNNGVSENKRSCWPDLFGKSVVTERIWRSTYSIKFEEFTDLVIISNNYRRQHKENIATHKHQNHFNRQGNVWNVSISTELGITFYDQEDYQPFPTEIQTIPTDPNINYSNDFS